MFVKGFAWFDNEDQPQFSCLFEVPVKQWNGWAMPWFTEEVMHALAIQYPTMPLRIRKVDGVLSFILAEDEEDEEDDWYTPECVMLEGTNEYTTKAYSFGGAHCWLGKYKASASGGWIYIPPQ